MDVVIKRQQCDPKRAPGVRCRCPNSPTSKRPNRSAPPADSNGTGVSYPPKKREADPSWIGLSFLLLTILFGGMYRILSGARIPWRYVIYGSFIAAVLFTMGKTLLGYYFVYTSTASIYGAAGSLPISTASR